MTCHLSISQFLTKNSVYYQLRNGVDIAWYVIACDISSLKSALSIHENITSYKVRYELTALASHQFVVSITSLSNN